LSFWAAELSVPGSPEPIVGTPQDFSASFSMLDGLYAVPWKHGSFKVRKENGHLLLA
jgi:hypothetical protein